MLVGPVFTREAAITPRRPRLYVVRTIYALSLFVLMCTAWLVLAGTQIVRDIGDMARFGAILFQILAPLQLALILFMAAIQSASTVALEKDKKTLILLLMTRLTNSELVLGKLSASLLHIAVLLATALPMFMMITLFGGISFGQVFGAFAVTAVSALVAGSLGSTFALWREKTFQSLALTAVTIVFWVGIWEGVGQVDAEIAGVSTASLAKCFSPVSAILEATDPTVGSLANSHLWQFVAIGLGIAFLLNGIAIARVRIWNPSRDIRIGQTAAAEDEAEHATGIFGEHVDGSVEATDESTRTGHIDARVREVSTESRRVWDNPVLWREICTWAYGRKILFIRAAYVLLFAMAFAALHVTTTADTTRGIQDEIGTVIPAAARIMGPFFLLSLVLVNALAVTSITNERDGRSLDLLLVTDLSPKEFLFGKLGGVLYVTKEMVILPLILPIYLGFQGGISIEKLVYVIIALGIFNVFVGTLGIHCGMTYSNSRQAIGVSLGTVFFLFLGVMTCMFMMVSFTGQFQAQLMPFLAFIVGGGVGLYVVLGHRNPSPAMALASGALPLAMFFAITSFLLDRPLSVFLVIAFTYGFTTTAMIMPALGEFNIAMGRTKTAEEDG